MISKEDFKNLVSDTDKLVLDMDLDSGTMILKKGTEAYVDRILSQSHGQEPSVTIIFKICDTLSIREAITETNVRKFFTLYS